MYFKLDGPLDSPVLCRKRVVENFFRFTIRHGSECILHLCFLKKVLSKPFGRQTREITERDIGVQIQSLQTDLCCLVFLTKINLGVTFADGNVRQNLAGPFLLREDQEEGFRL